MKLRVLLVHIYLICCLRLLSINSADVIRTYVSANT